MIEQMNFPSDVLEVKILQALKEGIDILVTRKVWDSIKFTKWLEKTFEKQILRQLYDKAVVLDSNDIGFTHKLKYKLKHAIFITSKEV